MACLPSSLSTFAVLSVLCARALATSVTVPLTAPSGAPSVAPQLIALSLEQDRWLDWAGNTSQNTFFFNTLNNLIGITGQPVHIRIGADSEDHTNFNPALEFVQAQFPNPTTTVPYPEASTIVVGDGYYQATQFLPPGTHVTYGLDLGQNNLTAVFLQTKSILKAFASEAVTSQGITLDFFEIGNEADLYGNNGLRNSSYTITNYVDDWVKFANNVTATAGLANSNTKFQGFAFAGSSHSTSGFSPQSGFQVGILNSVPGKLITQVSQHHYSGSFCSGNEGLLQDLMTKSTIRSNLTSFSSDISAVQAKGLNYVFGETNSYSCHGAPGVSNTAGAALWTLDYALFARTIGITRLFFHDGIGYKYNLIQPATLTRSTIDGSALTTPLAPHVQPQYYSAIISAEAIGSSGNTQLTELSINNTFISGYGFFDGGALKRAVFINSQSFVSGTRTSTPLTFSFSGSGTAPTSMVVKRLAIGHSNDTSGLTWGGQSYETSNAIVSGTLTTTTVPVSQGVSISETEVILLTFS